MSRPESILIACWNALAAEPRPGPVPITARDARIAKMEERLKRDSSNSSRSPSSDPPGRGPALPSGVAPDEAGLGFGPRARAVRAPLAGYGRMSERRIARVMDDLFGLPISPASACESERRTAEAPAPIHAEAFEYVRGLAGNVDEDVRGGRRRRADERGVGAGVASGGLPAGSQLRDRFRFRAEARSISSLLIPAGA